MDMGDAMRGTKATAAALLLSGCLAPVEVVPSGSPAVQPALMQQEDGVTPEDFVDAIRRVAPVAEALCRERSPGLRCNYFLRVLDRPDLPPNAFQTVDSRGRPVIVFTLSLVMGARNIDEIAFVLGHEAAHHILGHIPISARNAAMAEIVAGLDAAIEGKDAEALKAAEKQGATVGARAYSKDFELQADALGTEIAFRAGFDPVRGAAFFSRLPDPGDRFLGTHPPNAERIAVVRRTAAGLR